MAAINTVHDLIALALRMAGVIGVGQEIDPQDASDCWSVLRSMIGQFNRQRFLLYDLADTGVVSTGAQSYSVGPGQDFDIPRPDRLETAYLRLLNTPGPTPNPYDFPMLLVESREEYSDIPLKKLSTISNRVFYDSGWPTGLIYPWPIPPANQYEIHIVTKTTLPDYTSLAQEIGLPPEYTDVLLYNLSVRIRPLYQMQPDPTLTAMAKAALTTVREANAQVAQLRNAGPMLSKRGDITLGNLNGLPLGGI